MEQHADALYRFALLRTGAADAAEDLVQETFLAAVQGKQAFRMDSSERTWLIGILKHKLLDYYRKCARETLHADDFFCPRPGSWGQLHQERPMEAPAAFLA